LHRELNWNCTLRPRDWK